MPLVPTPLGVGAGEARAGLDERKGDAGMRMTRRQYVGWLLISEAKETYGRAWDLLSARQQQGELALVALRILSSQDDDVRDDRVREMIGELSREVLARGEG